MSSFRAFVWDPLLLICQMLCMQGVFYFVYSSVLIASSFGGFTVSLAVVFSQQPSRVGVWSQLLAALACSVALSLVVQRARQCLDFASTIHVFHLVGLIVYAQAFPTSLSWWLLQLSSVTLCTVLGEYLCMRVESREIKLVGVPSKYDL